MRELDFSLKYPKIRLGKNTNKIAIELFNKKWDKENKQLVIKFDKESQRKFNSKFL